MKQPIVYILDNLKVDGKTINRNSEQSSVQFYKSVIKMIEAMLRYIEVHEKKSLPKARPYAKKAMMYWNRKINDTNKKLEYLTFNEPPHQIVQW